MKDTGKSAPPPTKKKKLTNAFSVSLLAGLFLIGTNASAGILPSDTTVNYYDPATGAQSSVATAIKVEIPQYDVNTYLNNNFKNLEYGHTDSYDDVITNTYNSPIGDINVKYYDQTSKHHDAFMTGKTYNDKNISDMDFINAPNTRQSMSGINNYGAIRAYDWGGPTHIGTITANFVNNSISGTTGAAGTAINNMTNTSGATPSTITGIVGSFINNSAYVNSSGTGSFGATGTVYNEGSIGFIKGDFVGNSVNAYYNSSGYERAQGGAVNNNKGATIELLEGNYIANTAYGKNEAYGGAIYNNDNSTITAITGAMIANSARTSNSTNGIAKGGALYNYKSTVNNISSDFIANKADGYNNSHGGALYNQGTIENPILGNFINNTSVSYGGNARGGAIFNYNDSTIKGITSDFVGNKAEGYTTSFGGALYNQGIIENTIKGNFIKNVSISHSGSAHGGAVYNGNVINEITANFVGNSSNIVTPANSNIINHGGAIYNNSFGANIAEIKNLQGNFINNSNQVDNVDSPQTTIVYGGAIYNGGNIGAGSLDGALFYNNFVANNNDSHSNPSQYSTTISAAGGAIYNKSNTTDGILNNALFVKNSARAIGETAAGGAVYGYYGKELNAVFAENMAKSTNSDAKGGAVCYNFEYDNININNIKGSYIGNIADGRYGSGGALYIDTTFNTLGGSIENIEADFIGNRALSKYFNTEAVKGGGAIANIHARVKNISGNFISNEVTRNYGGAILNYGEAYSNESEYSIDNITSKTIQNNKAAYGGAIANIHSTKIGNINSDFIGNESTYLGGAVLNERRSTISNITANFIENVSHKDGGAIANNNSSVIENVTANFIGNTANSENYSARGGAVYNSNSDITIKNSTFIGNTATTTSKDADASAKGGAIYNDKNATVIADNFTTVFDGNSVTDQNGSRNEGIFGTKDSTLTLDAKNNGTFIVNDEINGEAQHNLNIKGDQSGKIYLNNQVKNANIVHENVTTYTNVNYLNSPDALNSLAMNSGVLNIGSLGLTNLHFDTFGMNGGNININNVQVDLDKQTMGRITANNYSESQTGNINIDSMTLVSDTDRLVTPILFADQSFKNTVHSNVKEIISPIYKYNVTYDTNNKYGDGGYFVFARGGGSGGSGGFNPAVLTAPVASQAGAQVAMNETFNYVFEHADAFTQLPVNQRMALIKSNQYAISTDYNNNLGSLAPNFNNKAGWFRPYVTFENMDLKNGPDVDITTYGSLVGFDTDFHKHRNGWNSVTTGYVGYNGSQIRHSGVDTTMNGGVLGLTETWYKGNFWTALTLSAGASVGESTTMYGKEDFTTLMAGAASKTGYNFEFKEGNFIIQPIWFMSYTFANMFDYTNAAGVKIDSDPMHTIQLHPSIRFIANTKNSWQPYASVGMVWNLMNETNVCANGVTLPQMSIKPYVEYGLGIQRLYKDNFTAFGQAMIRNGGRNGIALTAGLRWNIGKKSTETVNRGKIAKVIKQTNL